MGITCSKYHLPISGEQKVTYWRHFYLPAVCPNLASMVEQPWLSQKKTFIFTMEIQVLALFPYSSTPHIDGFHIALISWRTQNFAQKGLLHSSILLLTELIPWDCWQMEITWNILLWACVGKAAGIIKQTQGKLLGSFLASHTTAKNEPRMSRSEKDFGDHLVQPLMVQMEKSSPELKKETC